MIFSGLVDVYCDFTDTVNPIGHLPPSQPKIPVWGYEYSSRKVQVSYWPATETQIDAFYVRIAQHGYLRHQ